MRVIAGTLGGRRLVAPHGRGTRPTSDRVREALFSALADVRGASVLDLYAGTGALGIEALSRGARRAVFVENTSAALSALRENLEALGVAGVSLVVPAPALRALPRVVDGGPYDLVLADPPYARVAAQDRGAMSEVQGVLGRIVASGAVASHATVVLEHAARDPAPPISGLVTTRTRAYGDTALTFYVCDDPVEAAPVDFDKT